MQKAAMLLLGVLLLLAVILGSVLGAGNKCPEQLSVRIYNEDSDSYLLEDGVVEAVTGDEMTVEVLVGDNDVRMLLGYELTPTPMPEASPTPVVTPSPTPDPQFTNLLKWVEDRRFVTSEECTHEYLVKVVGQELCSTEVSYGHNNIILLGQIFRDTGMVYVSTGLERYELVYISGFDKQFLTHEEYVEFCIAAGINAGGTL
jgi:hypothetical protein